MPELDHRVRVITNAVYDKLFDEAGPLGLNFVGKYDEKRIPKYPSVVVSPGGRSKTLHAMGAGSPTFNIEMTVALWVYHGDMTVSHATRNEEDLRLVEKIEELFEEDYTLGGLVIFGFIAMQEPGIVQPNTRKSELIAGTRMDWVALSQKRRLSA